MIDFFQQQRNNWPLAKKNYDDLQGVRTRELTLSTGAKITVQCNPARIVSTAAKIDKEALAKRPCFLCEKNRPKEQKAFSPTQPSLSSPRLCRESSFEVLINPFPILPVHFTMPSKRHELQQLRPYFPVMLEFLDDFSENCEAVASQRRERSGNSECSEYSENSEFSIFYNGPHSGASAPDHMHFQIGLVKDIPYYNSGHTQGMPLQPEFVGAELVSASHWPGATLTIIDKDKQKVIDEFYRIYDNLPIPTLEYEPMFNVFARKTDGKYEVTLFLRSQHRPACYGFEEERADTRSAPTNRKRLISPGALDMAGLLITPRIEDFNTITAEEAEAIYNEVSAPELLDYLNYNLSHEGRKIAVGLIETEKDIRYTLNGNFKRLQLLNDTFFIPQNDEATFTIENVVIGVNFHWQQERNLTYSGILKLTKTPEGKNVAINILPIEDYLKSVISSEMSAMSDIELLKAHAILSRSWLIANIEAGRRPKNIRKPKTPTKTETLIWYDRSAHTIYDVCADDHCQRYQGVTMQTSPLVEEAVEATRGMVLTYTYKDGEIFNAEGESLAGKTVVCDARFSKCCGGRTEEYEYCWDDTHIPYLESVECPYCNTAEQLSQEEEKRVLSQVLNDYDLETRNFYRWTTTYRNPAIKDIIPLERGKSGRIWKMKLVYNNSESSEYSESSENSENSEFSEFSEEIIGKELEIRRHLSDSHLYSSWFNVHKTQEGFLLEGRGWGHGVGLCQIGAAVMAHKGFTYDQILLHYFPKSVISRPNT